MKLRKGHVFLFLVILVIGVMTRYVYSDINLDVDLLRESLENMPTVVLENLEFEREISGDLWSAKIPAARRKDRLVEVQSVDVLRVLPDGKKWSFKGTHGYYSEEAMSADMNGLQGTLEMDERMLNLKSPALSWSNETSEFLFPRGLILYDAEFFLETKQASFDASGSMALDEGAVIQWKRIKK